MAGYSRYVAIGDSQTEGLWDGDDTVGLRGFGDRLAKIVDTQYPGLTYANLAVRGRRIRDLLDDQLPQALAMDPDLVTVCIGMNDVTRPGLYFDHALAELDDLHAQLAGTGATVVTTTFPDLAQILPIGRILGARLLRINDAIRAAADRHDFRLVDLYDAPSITHPDTWSADRVHGSPKGHALFAAAAAEALFAWEQPRLGRGRRRTRPSVALVAGAVDAELAHALVVEARARPVRRRRSGSQTAPARKRGGLEAQDPQRDRRLPAGDRRHRRRAEQ